MTNKLVNGVLAVIVLAFVLNTWSIVVSSFGPNVFSNIVRDGVKGIRGGQ